MSDLARLKAARAQLLREHGDVATARAEHDAAVCEAIAAGATYRKVADITGLSRSTLDRIVNERQP